MPEGSWDAEEGGNQCPKHFGQSGHPSPDPEARTNPPIKISSKVLPTVNNAAFWYALSFIKKGTRFCSDEIKMSQTFDV